MNFVKPRPAPIRNILIEQLKPEQLHAQWAWLKRGAEDIWKKIQPHSEWIPEDLYAALRYPQASNIVLWIVLRNFKALGWCCGQIEQDKYGKLEFFLWCAWDIPENERAPEDDVEGAREQMQEYMKVWAKSRGCVRVATLSARKLEALGWIKANTVYYLPL